MNELDLSWSAWAPEDIDAAAERVVAMAREHVAEVARGAEDWTFEGTVRAMDRANALEEIDALKIVALENLHPDAAVRDRAHERIVKLRQDMLDIWFAPEMYAAIAPSRELSLDPVTARMRDENLTAYERMGFGKSDEVRREVTDITKQLNELEKEFNKNIVDIRETISLSEAETAGIPASLKDRLDRDEAGAYVLKLDYPEYVPFMESALSSDKRREAYIKNNQRGGERNLEILKRLMTLRLRRAQLLGYRDHADYQTAVRMAGSGKAAGDFLADLASKLRPGATVDLDMLRKAKQEYLGDPEAKIEAWDILFYERLTTEKLFGITNEELRPYFSLAAAEKAMFSLYGDLFGITFEQVEKETWHPEVRVYAIKEAADGALIGYAALDMFPRDGKFGHMAVEPMVVQATLPDGTMAIPFAILMGNFSPPSATTPSLLTHEELATLFHEFGHVIHMVLSKSPYHATSNIAVRWDFIEAPSQFLENWIWEPAFLKGLAVHYQTGEPLSDEKIAQVIAKKKHLQRYFNARQCTLALFDLAVHQASLPADPVAEYARISREISGIEMPEEAWFVGSFGHLTDYSAAYYGYLWSQVYAADLFTRFAGDIRNPKIGMEYRRTVLEGANTREPMELVREFLGREPSSEAFLKDLGI